MQLDNLRFSDDIEFALSTPMEWGRRATPSQNNKIHTEDW